MVYFVGAGSGAADLITVRGMHMLQQADVIIYAGSLVNPELLQYAKTDCEIHNSAKLTLEEVLQIMQEAQEQGEDVGASAHRRTKHLWCGAGADGCTGCITYPL